MSLTNKFPEKDVNELFSRVAPNYDRMNNVVSFGIQKLWRKKFLANLNLNSNSTCLDLCCGTADSSIQLAQVAKKVVGLDFNQEMLKLAEEKVKAADLADKVKLVQADAMNLPFASESFDLVTICFGLRNVPSAEKTIRESLRVLKPGGQFAIMEMSQPTNPIAKMGWKAYFKIFPQFARLTHSNVADYQYLSKTSREFLSAEQLKKLLEQNGFTQVAVKKLSLGTAAIHLAIK